MAYVGGLLDAGRKNFEYRNYLPYFKAIMDKGIHVHAFPSSSCEGKMDTACLVAPDANLRRRKGCPLSMRAMGFQSMTSSILSRNVDLVLRCCM